VSFIDTWCVHLFVCTLRECAVVCFEPYSEASRSYLLIQADIKYLVTMARKSCAALCVLTVGILRGPLYVRGKP
jgi:hypothetical protein